MEARARGGDVLLLETPFMSQTGNDEVRAYVQSKYNLALLALGSYIRAHSDLSVHLINMVKDRIGEDALLERLRPKPPKVVGVPLYSYNLSFSYRIISRIKAEFPDAHICVGGPHVTMFPRETIQLPNVDSVVIGDGEEPFLQICRQVSTEGRLDEAQVPPGTTTKASLAAGRLGRPWTVENLDSLPMPDLSLLGDYKRYRDFLSNDVMAILTTSRGCPYACHYCSSGTSRYRSFSVKRIIDIMRHYRGSGVEYIEFWDETFNPNKRRLAEFAEAMERADLRIPWGIRGSVVLHVPDDTLARLKNTGLRVMQFGVETVQPRLISYINKRTDRVTVKQAFDTCRKAGVRTVANLMINIPGETRQEIVDDLRFLREIKATYISIGVYNWAPGTVHYARALREGVLGRDHWREYAANPVGEEPVLHADTGIEIKEIYRLRDRFVWRFYFSPIYIFRYLWAVEPKELRRAIAIAGLLMRSRLRLFRSAISERVMNRRMMLPGTAGKRTGAGVRKRLVEGLPEVSHTVQAE